MSILNSAFLFDLESNMRIVTENTYGTLSQNQWVDKLAKEMPSGSSKERLIWLISTGFVEYGTEGQVQFMDLATVSQEFTNGFISGSGLRLLKSQMEDLDGGGVQAATEWSKVMGALAANFKQQEVARAIVSNSYAGPTAYDGVSFFHASNAGGTTGHPVDPTNPGVNCYANLFTGVANANNPGALPIHLTGAGAVTLDVAQANLSKAVAYIRNIKQPNGINPRKLKPVKLFVPQALAISAALVTGAKIVAGGATGGAGSNDVQAMIDNFGLEVVVCDELGATYGGSDTSYLIGCEMPGLTQGAFTYVNREPFSISYHGPMTDAQLASKRVFEWFPQGRSVVGPGHPFLLFQARAT